MVEQIGGAAKTVLQQLEAFLLGQWVNSFDNVLLVEKVIQR